MSLDPVVVVSSRVPVTVGQEAESLTVITRDRIERMGVVTGQDLLRQVPGVQVDQLGGPGGISQVYIRGSDPNHVLVLIDGVRMNDPTNSRGGGFDISNLDPNQIERIEVLRGAASAIYGADAMGGVINVVMRKAQSGGSASVAAGGLGFRSASARATWHSSPLSYLSASASSHRDGFDSENGRIKLSQASLSGRREISSNSHLEVSLQHFERTSSAFPDDSGGVVLAKIRTLEQRKSQATTVGVRGTADFATWTLSLGGNGFQQVEDIDSPGVAPGIRSAFGSPAAVSSTKFQRHGVLLGAVKHIDGGSELAMGGEYQLEHGKSHTVYDLFGMSIPANFDLKRSTQSLFTELKWLVRDGLIVRAGMRNDSIEDSGSHLSTSFGVRYSYPSTGGALKASYSEGFKPPSFFALGLPRPLGGNPDLKAELSKGGSIGYEQRFAHLGDFSAAVFRRRYSGLVTFDNSNNQLANADKVDVKGAEISLQSQVSDIISVEASFTRLMTHVSPSGEPLRQRPGQRAGVQINVKLQDMSTLEWRVEYANGIFDSSIPTGNILLRTYFRNDLSFTYALSKNVKLVSTIDNVADRSNQWYVGARSPGRRARIGVTLTP